MYVQEGVDVQGEDQETSPSFIDYKLYVHTKKDCDVL